MTDCVEKDLPTDQFLGFLAHYIANHPERLQAIDKGLVDSIRAMVGDIDVDLSATLSAEGE